MIANKTKPVGVDIQVQALQNYLYVQLQNKWGISAADYNAYGRVYRNQVEDGGYSPEVYLGSNEYSDTFFDDKVKVLSFFSVGEMQKFNGGLGGQVALIFCVTDLAALKPAIPWRADEEVRMDVEILCHNSRYGFTLESVETGIDNVFREYSGWKKKKGIQFMDMHPFHCFRVNLNIQPYSVSIC